MVKGKLVSECERVGGAVASVRWGVRHCGYGGLCLELNGCDGCPCSGVLACVSVSLPSSRGAGAGERRQDGALIQTKGRTVSAASKCLQCHVHKTLVLCPVRDSAGTSSQMMAVSRALVQRVAEAEQQVHMCCLLCTSKQARYRA